MTQCETEVRTITRDDILQAELDHAQLVQRATKRLEVAKEMRKLFYDLYVKHYDDEIKALEQSVSDSESALKDAYGSYVRSGGEPRGFHALSYAKTKKWMYDVDSALSLALEHHPDAVKVEAKLKVRDFEKLLDEHSGLYNAERVNVGSVRLGKLGDVAIALEGGQNIPTPSISRAKKERDVRTQVETVDTAKSLLRDEDTRILKIATTGTGDNAEVIRVVILSVDGEVIINQSVQPVGDVEFGASQYHGITTESLADSPVWGDVVKRVMRELTDKHIVTYGAKFTRKMLYQTDEVSGCEAGDWYSVGQWHCLMEMSAGYLGQSKMPKFEIALDKITGDTVNSGDPLHHAIKGLMLLQGMQQ